MPSTDQQQHASIRAGQRPLRLTALPLLVLLLSCAATTIATPHTGEGARPAHRDRAEENQPFELQSIHQTVREFMERQLEGGTAEIDVDLLYPQDPIALPAGAVKANLSAIGNPARLGRRTFRLRLTVDGRLVETVKVLADVSMITFVVTPVRLIRPQETISEEDVTLAEVSLRTATHSYTSELNRVVGMRAVRPLRAHAPIHVSALAQPYLVKKGERVTIEARRGGLRIQTIGVAHAAGHLGQTLTVTNLDSKRRIQARVAGPSLVEVDF